MAYADLEKRRATHRRTEKWQRDKIRRFLDQLKTATACADCKRNYPPYVMDFDHLRDKKRAVSKCSSMTSVRAEIVKCDIVCSNCHRERTHKRKVNLLN